jgi:hypothetical protein
MEPLKKIGLPVIVLAIIVSAFAAVTKMSRERSAARAETAVLAERLARAEAVSAAVLKIDELYHQEKAENAALAARLAIAESAALDRAELKDAVADRPKPKKKKKKPVRPTQLPGYNR